MCNVKKTYQTYLLICIILLHGIIETIATQQFSQDSSGENEDDYLTQKENVLEKSYHGLIRENETNVEITPLIKVDEEKICSFHILKKPYHEIPFQISLINNLGILKARRTLNCEKRKSYHFEIVAIFCDGTRSASAKVHISVIDINEYAPTFIQPSYVTEVDEGRLYKEIIRVEATDKDCTPLFGDICKYEILNTDQPFAINNEGSIKNTEPLSHKASHNYILSVVAYDCAMKQSTPILVSIKVRRVCEARFLGIPERIDYIGSTIGSLSLFPNARLELCDIKCNNKSLNIHVSVALKTKHISFGCDRDLTNCSSGPALVDLLPRGVEWTKNLNYDEGTEPILHFDGSSGVIVPNDIIKHDFSTQSFSIVAIFRHMSQSSNNKHLKEHIVCNADDHKMNRHHMALFVRNCRLIFLLRKNFNEGDLNIFSPAEWRWKIPQVCDNEWHHYILNVDRQLSKIDLYIDGIKFQNSVEDRHSNPEVIDDWPLHAAHGVDTTLAVGACYQSSENRLKHAFTGDISSIKMSLNEIFSPEDVKCGTNCAEHLLAPPENLLEAESQMQTNAQLNEMFIEGQSKANIEQLLQMIQYTNTKKNPTIGRRNIEVRSTMMCINQSATRLPTVETYIMVSDPKLLTMPIQQINREKIMSIATSAPINLNQSFDNLKKNKNKINKIKSHDEKTKIIITGKTNKLVSYPEIKAGVYILENVNITVLFDDAYLSSLQSLDSCSVIVFPSLNPDHEQIEINGDETLSSTLEIKTNINKDGVEMVGNDRIENYLDVLKALIYSNKKPAYYLNRVFKLSCSQFSAQYKSAEFTLTLTVLHPKPETPTTTNSPLSAAVGGFYVNEASGSPLERNLYSHAMIHTHDVQEPKSKAHSIIHKVENSHPTMLIILICVFLVILLCVVSIARIKNNNKYTDQHQPCPKVADESLVWDDSALTITINPMQADVISSDSSDTENSDSEDEEVSKGKYNNVNQLEWDNSNIFTSTVN